MSRENFRLETLLFSLLVVVLLSLGYLGLEYVLAKHIEAKHSLRLMLESKFRGEF